MKIDPYENWNALRGASVALGMFDGMHIGHQNVIHMAAETAHSENRLCVVYTFANHPLTVLNPEAVPQSLQSNSEKTKDMEKCGADIVLLIPFTKDFANRPAEVFARKLLDTAAHVFVGENYSFGQGGRGTPALLQAMAQSSGCLVHIVPLTSLDGTPVSSTRLRAARDSGEWQLYRCLRGETEK